MAFDPTLYKTDDLQALGQHLYNLDKDNGTFADGVRVKLFNVGSYSAAETAVNAFFEANPTYRFIQVTTQDDTGYSGNFIATVKYRVPA